MRRKNHDRKPSQGREGPAARAVAARIDRLGGHVIAGKVDTSAAVRDPGRPAGATSVYSRIYSVVSRIPRGRVATYGQVAALAGLPGHARQVGYALHALPNGSDTPWHRVVNARGGISRRAEPGYDHIQRLLLEAEGLSFDANGRLDLARHAWRPHRTARSRRS